MLADPAFCDLAYTIGVASLAATEKQIWHLTKLYWYTVEFGVVREDGDIKAFGAGMPRLGGLSSMLCKAVTKFSFLACVCVETLETILRESASHWKNVLQKSRLQATH